MKEGEKETRIMAEGPQVEGFGDGVPPGTDGAVASGPRWEATGEVGMRADGRSAGFSGSEYRRAGGGMAGFEQPEKETQVKPRPATRRYSREYKLQVLKDTENLPEGAVGAYLRREGLYYGTLKMFREHRQRGLLEEGQPSIAMKGGRGNRPRKHQNQNQNQNQNPGTDTGGAQAGASPGGVSLAQMQRRIAELEKQNRKLSYRVRQTEALLDLQKKASELLGISLEGLSMSDE